MGFVIALAGLSEIGEASPEGAKGALRRYLEPEWLNAAPHPRGALLPSPRVWPFARFG